MFDLSNKVCPAGLDLTGGTRLDLKETPQARVDITDTTTSVSDAAGSRSLYQAFQLPFTSTPMQAVVQSLPTYSNLMAPRLIMLDGLGQMTREIKPDAFQFREDILSVVVRLRASERTLVVASAPDLVKRPLSRLLGRTEMRSVGQTTIVTGREDNLSYVLSHSGRVTVKIEPLPDTRIGP